MRCFLLLAPVVFMAPLVYAQSNLLDGFESLAGWEAIHSHGDARAPGGGFILKSPVSVPLKLVKSDKPGIVRGDNVTFRQLPIRIRLEY